MATTDDELVSLLGLWTTEWHGKHSGPEGTNGLPSKYAYLAEKIADYYSGIIESVRTEAYDNGYDDGRDY